MQLVKLTAMKANFGCLCVGEKHFSGGSRDHLPTSSHDLHNPPLSAAPHIKCSPGDVEHLTKQTLRGGYTQTCN